MPISFPGSLDNFINPVGTDPTTGPDHAGQHANANDAIEALEAKVGADSSAVTSSLDWLIKHLAVNVKTFGATGNGSTDDSTAINSAISAAQSGGGFVYFPLGTFAASNINIAYDNLTFLGQGPSSVVKLINGANTNLFTVSATANRFFVTFFNFKIDGNKANNSSGAAIYAHFAHTWLIDRMHIANAAAEGIRFEGNGSFFALNNRVRACRIEDSNSQGINLQGFSPNNHIENNIIGGTSNWYGIEDTNSENRILGNHIHGTAGHGIYANGSTNGHYVDNYIESSNGSGIYVETASVGARIEANTCFNNGLISAGDGITVAGTDVSVIGNRCYDRQTTKTQDYGIQLKASSSRVIVVGNHARASENQTGGILDSGSSNLVAINADGAIPGSVTVRKNTGADIGSRPRLNFIEGSNVTLTIADDAGSNEVDITIAAAGGGGAGASVVQEDDVTVDPSVGTFDFNHGLDVTSSPAGEANISVDETELDFSGSKMNVGMAFGMTGIITPTTLTGNVDDYNPTGLQNSGVIRIDGGASNRNITGITAPSSAPIGGRIIIIENIGTTNLTLKHDITSVAANRFYGPNDADVVLQTHTCAIIEYDSTLSRWMILSGGRNSTAGPDADVTIDAAGAAGTAGTFARSLHGHKLSTSASNPVALGTAAPGTSGHSPSRDDHVHPTTGLVLDNPSNLSGELRLQGDISPPQITADQNDYAPTGMSGATILRLSTNAQRSITGLTGGTDGRLILIQNVGGFPILFPFDSASSTAANRFYTPQSVTAAVQAGGEALLTYDATVSRWRIFGPGGVVANDPIWNAKGDIAIATGPDASQVLPVGGVDGYVLTVDSSNGTFGVSWLGTSSGGAGDWASIWKYAGI